MLRPTRLLLLAFAISTGSALALAAAAVPGAAAAGPAPERPGAAGRGGDGDRGGDWEWPVERPLRVVAPYRAPAQPYGPGHRGIDLAAAAGAIVRAPAAGTISFSGMVAGRPVVSIAHGDGVISSMEPVAGTLAVGEEVAPGDPIGLVAAGGHCDGCIHLGIRVDGRYVSPFVFLGGLPRAVLLPLG